MTIRAASDRSLLVTFGEGISLVTHLQVFHLTRALEGVRGILNLHPAYASLLVEFDPRQLDHAQMEEILRERAAGIDAASHADESRLVEIPVHYGGEFGPDLEDVARHTGLSPERVIEMHSAAEYLVYFLGFAPGFAYLGGLPPELATPRLSAPRKRVPKGSVAIGGNQTGVYPIESPGGWRIIGHTEAKLFDPGAAEPVLLRMGDRLRFTHAHTNTTNPQAAPHATSPPPHATSPPPHATSTLSSAGDLVAGSLHARGARPPTSAIRILAPGFLTTVQDLGRYRRAHRGISASGAADALALRAGNLLVGNAENAPALEMTLAGGEFEFEEDAIVALTGSDFGAGLPLWTPLEMKAGSTLRSAGTKAGARCYLAVRGGIDTPLTLGSASAHLLTGVGGTPLRKGAALGIGNAAVRKPRAAAKNPPQWQRASTVRVTDGPQAEWFQGELYHGPYAVAEECNRMGIRLSGAPIPSPVGGMLTEGVALGAIQVPPDGQPIVLFVEHQTTGGYPKPANVISADFWRLGQMRPRDEVRFEKVSIEYALQLLQAQEKWLYLL